MLTDRRAAILALVVNDYVQTAEPVSSRALVDRHRLSISTATVRNELARLEEDGYITHPYTSAGRIPSDVGYRHYVEALMAEEPVDDVERRTIEHQLHQVLGGLEEWLSLSATILAGAVGNVAVVTRPRGPLSRLKHAQLVELHGETALLVAVMDDGRVRQRMLTLDRSQSQRQLAARADRLNARLAGGDAKSARRVAAEMTDADDEAIALALAELIDEQRFAEETYLDGLSSVLHQPEFSDVERMLAAVGQLEAYRVRHLLETAADEVTGSMRVVIGSEHGDQAMHDWSVVTSSFGDETTIGTVAVVGPTRMRYQRTIPRVRYVAALMSKLLHDVRA